MGSKEKLLDKAIRNPQGLNFDDFENLLSLCDGNSNVKEEVIVFGIHQLTTVFLFNPKKMGKQNFIKLNNFYNNINKKMSRPKNYDWDKYTLNMYKDEQGDWLVYLLELPNVSAFGDTPEEALDELYEAYEGMKECYLEDGELMPKPSSKLALI
jgi:predicted RNase H-like HicB family nuclease